MMKLFFVRWRQWKWFAGLIFLLLAIMLFPVPTMGIVYADDVSLPEEVARVDGEKQLIKELLAGMERHQSYFSFYYPEIAEDFERYHKKSSVYAPFIDKLEAENGYLMGIVSGVCVSVCGTTDRFVSFQFHYLTTVKQEKKIDRKVKKIAGNCRRGTRAERIKQAYDYLLSHMQYDKRYYSPYYAFTKGRGICMTYALAFQRIMQKMRIPCVYVKGKNHAWNMVQIGKVWYNVDATWDDANGGYRYFLKADADFPGHKYSGSPWISKLKKAQKSYSLSGLK
ncbi:MAG: hypothetical protein NC124_16170 [Clostridium sp.]|nr:hypothetical protein [Clostridium sp.]